MLVWLVHITRVYICCAHHPYIKMRDMNGKHMLLSDVDR